MSFYKKISIILACLTLSSPVFAKEGIQVWGIKASPYVRKVLLTLEHKKIPYTLNETLPKKLLDATKTQGDPEFFTASPLGKIPAIKDGDFSLADSSVIISYLEKKYPEHSLYPKDSKKLALSLWFEKYADTVLNDVIHQKIFFERFVKPEVLQIPSDENVVASALKGELPTIFDYLEKELSKNGGAWLVGDELTIGDIGVATHFVSLRLSDVQIDKARWPHLFNYSVRVLNEPIFQKLM